MYNNKLYNTRKSGRFNTPGNFVSAAPEQQQVQQPQQQFGKRQPQQPQRQNDIPVSNVEDVKHEEMETADVDMTSKVTERPAWMKSTNCAGVKKISNKERRRRQNETLRRLLSPKNALMVLNEMMPKAQVSNQFRVEPAAAANFYNARNAGNFCADLTIDGGSYKGYGENKLSARNAAAEQAFRDLIIARMNKLGADALGGSTSGAVEPDDEALPMIQLASFALHKLFTEWECDGHKVPQLRPSTASLSEDAPAEGVTPTPGRKKGSAGPRVLPANASAMHPCMLLTYMRPGLDYRELHVAGDKPQNITFTMGVDVDGQTFIGKAGNKKEARRQAAISACTTLFGVTFDEKPLATKPEHY